jgi:1,4-dihydroxy-2-naphthoyl-CoA synthase
MRFSRSLTAALQLIREVQGRLRQVPKNKAFAAVAHFCLGGGKYLHRI